MGSRLDAAAGAACAAAADMVYLMTAVLASSRAYAGKRWCRRCGTAFTHSLGRDGPADGRLALGQSVETETEVSKVDVGAKPFSKRLGSPIDEGQDVRASKSVTAKMKREVTATASRSRTAGFAVPEESHGPARTRSCTARSGGQCS